MDSTLWIVLGLVAAFVIVAAIVFFRRSNAEVTGELSKDKATFSAKSKEEGENKARVSGVILDGSTDTHVTAKGSGSEVSDVSAKDARGGRVKAEK